MKEMITQYHPPSPRDVSVEDGDQLVDLIRVSSKN